MLEFDWISEPDKSGYRQVMKDGLYGLIDKEGYIRIPCQYEQISSDYLCVKRDGKWGVFNIYGYIGSQSKEGKLIEPCRWDSAVSLSYSYVLVSLGGKFGVLRDNNHGSLVHTKYQILIPCQWDGVEVISGGSDFFRVEHRGKYGLISDSGQLITPPVWEDIKKFKCSSYGYARIPVKQGEKWGYLNAEGKQICPCIWEDATGKMQVMEGGKWGILDPSGVLCIPCRWDEIHTYNWYGYKVRLGDKWGILDRDGKLTVDCQWDDTRPEYPHNKVCREGKWGLLNKEKEFVTDCQWEAVDVWLDHISVKKGGKYGWLDLQGNIMIRCQWDDIREISPGICRVKKDGKYGLISRDEQIVSEVQWDDISTTKLNGQEMLKAKLGDRTVYLDLTGKELMDSQWDTIEPIRDGISKVSKNGKFGLIDENSQLVAPCCWDSIAVYRDHLELHDKQSGGFRLFRDGKIDETWDLLIDKSFFFIAFKDGKVGLVNNLFEPVLPCVWEDVGERTSGLYAVKRGGKWGYTEKGGTKPVIPCLWDEAENFYGTIAPVRTGDKWGFIRKDGTVAVPPRYDRCPMAYTEGFPVVKDNKWGLVDKTTGEEIIPCVWEDIRCQDGLYPVKQAGKWGLIDAQSKQILPCRWDEISVDHLFKLRKGDKWALYTRDGQPVTEACLEEVKRFFHSYIRYKRDTSRLPIARVKKDGRYGYIRSDGTWLSQCIWTDADDGCSDNRHWVKLGQFSAYLDDLSGQLSWTRAWIGWRRAERLENNLFRDIRAVPLDGKVYLIRSDCHLVGIYDSISPCRNPYEHMLAKKDGKFGVLSSDGSCVLAPEYEEISFGIEDILVKKNGVWRYFMPGRNIFLPGKFTQAEHFLGTHARAKMKGVRGLADQHGNFFPQTWTDYGARVVEQMNEGMLLMEYEGRLGLADKNGTLVTPCIFEDVGICQENAIAVKLFGSWGFVDRKGRMIVNCRWDNVTHFRKGLARVCHRDRWYAINKREEIFLPANFHEGLAKAQFNSQWGYVDNRGNVAFPFQWDDADHFKNGFAQVRKDGIRHVIERP